MRFHKAESAFFVFIAMVFGAGVTLLASYGVMRRNTHLLHSGGFDEFTLLLFVTGVLLATAITFGMFFIYPLIRTQVEEEGKLRAMTESLSARSETLEYAAYTDSLTGTHNRRYFDDALEEYLREFGRIQRPVGLIVLDLDHFKQINDGYGHDVGDEVLRQVAACLQELMRHHDVVARLGGEEFAIIAPNMTEHGLAFLGERVRAAVSALVLDIGDLRVGVSTSVGVAIWDGEENAEAFYRRADRMLYRAKRMGRNRVCA
ncbi:GGDEF domain-containing protein [Chelativorans sp. AA-79]|uniref:GGDEF domain-containing protein n=1 Tax=Chelativorans sp. AA-79 TaxID=3028735 RepID=UPI0023FA009A|nr:GGDEF domain-containing protein [Chelativorans sp. AA-79]WEX11386.1 GGDEF domain-containing protein [Chelativorans sp. AA-79]